MSPLSWGQTVSFIETSLKPVKSDSIYAFYFSDELLPELPTILQNSLVGETSLHRGHFTRWNMTENGSLSLKRKQYRLMLGRVQERDENNYLVRCYTQHSGMWFEYDTYYHDQGKVEGDFIHLTKKLFSRLKKLDFEGNELEGKFIKQKYSFKTSDLLGKGALQIDSEEYQKVKGAIGQLSRIQCLVDEERTCYFYDTPSPQNGDNEHIITVATWQPINQTLEVLMIKYDQAFLACMLKTLGVGA
jgi:hypothetical protein